MNNQTLKDNLAKLLEVRSIKVASLASKIGMHRETLTQIVRGEVKNPGIYTVAKIATALDVSLDELMGDKTIITRQSKDITVTNFELYEKITIYLTGSINKRSSKTSMGAIFEGTKEIYKFSVSANQLNKEFADWYIEKYF